MWNAFQLQVKGKDIGNCATERNNNTDSWEAISTCRHHRRWARRFSGCRLPKIPPAAKFSDYRLFKFPRSRCPSNNVVTVICHKLLIWVQLTRGLENFFEVKNIRLCWLQGMRHDPLFIDFGCKSALGRHIVYGSSVAAYNDDVHRKWTSSLGPWPM